MNDGETTTFSTSALTMPDGTVYISNGLKESGEETAAHEIVHIKMILGDAAYVEFESVVAENINWDSESYKKIAPTIAAEIIDKQASEDEIKEHGGRKAYIEEKINDLDFGKLFLQEITAAVNQFCSTDMDTANRLFEGLFTDWNAVVEASRQFNKDIGADFSESASFMPENESVLPEVSAVAPEADPIKDDAFAARGLERLTEEQRFLKSIGETLGRKVEFRNLDKWVKDPETGKRRRVSPGGMINKTTGVLYLNSSKYANQNALREVLKHEITHFAEVDTEAYALLQKGIMDSQVFKDWVKRKNYKGTVNEDGYAVSATSNMNAAYIKRYAESGLEGTEVFKGTGAEDAANREMVADFVAENLFTDDMSRLRDALSDVQPEVVNKFKQWILDLLKKLKNAFRSQAKVYASIEGIESEFVRVCKSAQRIWEQNHKPTAEQQKTSTESGSYSIKNTSKISLAEQLRLLNKNQLKTSDSLYFGNTPNSIVNVLGDKPLAMTITNYNKSRKEKHNVPRRCIKNLVNSLSNAYFSFGIDGKTGFIVPDIDADGKPLLVAIDKNSDMDRKPVNEITSIYGLDNPKEWLSNQIAEGKEFVVYNEKEANAFLQTYGYKASVEEGIQPLYENVSQNTENVKQNLSPDSEGATGRGEEQYSLSDTVSDDGKRLTFKSSELKYSYENGELVIENITTPLQERGQGSATKLMNAVIQKAYDESIEKVTGYIYPQDNDTSLERLRDFYEKFGAEIDSYDFFEITPYETGEEYGAAGESVQYSLPSGVDRYWYPAMSRKDIEYVKRRAKYELNTTENYIDNMNKWLYNEKNGKVYFALYSTENADAPTVLYACKGNRADFEHEFLTQYFDEKVIDDEGIHERTKIIDQILKDYGNVDGNRTTNRRDVMGRGSDGGNVAVHRKNSRNRPSEALLNCLRNIKEISDRNRAGLNDKSAFSMPESKQYSLPQEVEEEYMSAVESGDTEAQSRLVEFAAKNAGYVSKALHGTPNFGFTILDVSKSDDKMSFFATDSFETASTYSPSEGARRIGNAARRTSSKEYQKQIDTIKSDVHAYAEHLKSQYDIDISEFKSRFMTALNEQFKLATKTGIDAFWETSYLLGESAEAVKTELYNRYQNDPDNKKMSFKRFENSEYWQSVVDDNNTYFERITDNLQNLFMSDDVGGVYELYANTDGHLVIDCNGRNWNNIKSDALPWRGVTNRWTTRSVVQYAKDNGYTGVTFKNLRDSGNDSNIKPATVYAFFNPQQQLKSADLVTYDDEGNVIPLSERFNPQNEDLRYSLPIEEQYDNAVKSDNKAEMQRLVDIAAKMAMPDSAVRIRI